MNHVSWPLLFIPYKYVSCDILAHALSLFSWYKYKAKTIVVPECKQTIIGHWTIPWVCERIMLMFICHETNSIEKSSYFCLRLELHLNYSLIQPPRVHSFYEFLFTLWCWNCITCAKPDKQTAASLRRVCERPIPRMNSNNKKTKKERKKHSGDDLILVR